MRGTCFNRTRTLVFTCTSAPSSLETLRAPPPNIESSPLVRQSNWKHAQGCILELAESELSTFCWDAVRPRVQTMFMGANPPKHQITRYSHGNPPWRSKIPARILQSTRHPSNILGGLKTLPGGQPTSPGSREVFPGGFTPNVARRVDAERVLEDSARFLNPPEN